MYLAFSLRSETQDTVLVFSLFRGASLEEDFPTAMAEFGGETLNLERFATGRPEVAVSWLGT